MGFQMSSRKENPLELKKIVEDNVVIWFLGTLLTGFLGGIATYKALQEISIMRRSQRQSTEDWKRATPNCKRATLNCKRGTLNWKAV